jgi:2-polyprenyl-3-methyl-5-hydroxy-6-metoxy-1,4-benzoquinol methylase
MINHPVCWCGNHDFSPFSSAYLLCENCKTLVLIEWPEARTFKVDLDDQAFYGKSYWFEHQENDLQFGNILTRARTDIPERVMHWLSTLLKYKLPPGNTLELGCSHGGFVAALQWAGFQASGLELSPWVVDFASQAFQIPMYQGRLEDQQIIAGSLDAVILMDVLEHLPDPISTISAAITLLKKDGVLIIQTPCYPEGRSFESLQKENDPFLLMFQPPEHVYLFSQSSVRQFLKACNLPYVQFEPAHFGMYDMFLVASQTPLQVNTRETIDQALMSTPTGRLVLALLDQDAESKDLKSRLQESENDRAARLDQVNQYDIWLKESRAEIEVLQNRLEKFSRSFVYKVGRRLGMF